MTSIGRDLLDVPFHQMVQNLAFAISRGQYALDRTSLETARVLARETVQLIPEIHEIIEPLPHPAHDEAGNPLTNPDGSQVVVTGARVHAEAMDPETYTLLQAGLLPTFYQFTDTIIEVKISISTRTSTSSEFEVGASLQASASWGWGSASFASSVNYKTSNQYSYSAEGSSLLRTTLRPVPPPPRLSPRIVTVNTFPLSETPPRPVEVTIS